MFFNCCLFKAAGNRRYNISRRSPASLSHKSSKTGILNRQKTGPEPSVSCKNGYFKRAVAQPGAMAFTILHGRLLRKAAARTKEALWQTAGQLLDLVSSSECQNYLANA